MAIVRTIKIREVWSHNLESEFSLIRSLIDDYSFVAMDTEFPGVLFRQFGTESRPKYTSPAKHYSLLKQNVDALKIIQLGLTLVDSKGNLPNLGNPKVGYIWQFNFKDFDVTTDNQSPDSVELLRNHGIDFDMNSKSGVDSVKFAELMMSSGLVCNDNSVTWLTFHCAYDFGYLVKVLTQSQLPSSVMACMEDWIVLPRRWRCIEWSGSRIKPVPIACSHGLSSRRFVKFSSRSLAPLICTLECCMEDKQVETAF